MLAQDKKQDPLRVAVYLRVSTEEQVEAYGLGLQRTAVDALIESRKYGDSSLIFAGDQYVYSDEGVSGTTELVERSGFLKLKEDLVNAPEGEKPFDAVAVYKIDRFARRLKVLLDVVEFFKENKVQFLSVNESIDTSTPFGRAMVGIIGVIAELEIETTAKRTRDGWDLSADRGTMMGSTPPYGFIKNEEKKPEILEDEAVIVRNIFDLYVNQKYSPEKIAFDLKNRQILSPSASALHHKKKKGVLKKKNNLHHWQVMTVYRILTDEHYIGRIYYAKQKDGKKLPKEEWKLASYEAPRIIDILTFTKAQKQLENSRCTRKISDRSHIYLLSGLLKCDCCYSANSGDRIRWSGEKRKKKNGKGYTYYYKCGKKQASKHSDLCTSVPMRAGEVENYIVKKLFSLLDNPRAVFEYQNKLKSTQKGVEQLKKQQAHYLKALDAVPNRKAQLTKQHELEIIGTAQLKKGFKEISVEEKNFKNRLMEIDQDIAQYSLTEGYQRGLEEFSVKYKKAMQDINKNREELFKIIHLLIEDITVYTRPIKNNEKIAGRQKKDQQIPYRLHIKLKLPQEILHELMENSVLNNISSAR